MKVWIINHYALNMFNDRAGRHYWFASELIKRGYDVTVFTASTNSNGKTERRFDGKYSVSNEKEVPFVFVKTSEYEANGADRILNWINFYKNVIPSALKIAKEKGAPDAIIASSVHPLTMLAGEKIAKKLRVPCICEIRDLWPEAIFTFGRAKENGLIGKAMIRGEHYIYKKADALIFTKEGDTDYLKERGWTTAQGGDIDLGKCNYINNGIVMEDFSKQIVSQAFEDADLDDPSTFKAIYCGAIRPVNNIGNIVDCAALARDRGEKDIRFIIYGDGFELDRLKQRAADENLTNIVFKGRIEKKKIPYILSKSSVNLLNYSYDKYNWTRGNSSNKLFEYMASGKPVISTVRMGYSIINKYRCGTELDECTPECLLDAIVRIKNLPEEEYTRLGKNGLEGAKDFDFSVLTDKLEKVIGSVVG